MKQFFRQSLALLLILLTLISLFSCTTRDQTPSETQTTAVTGTETAEVSSEEITTEAEEPPAPTPPEPTLEITSPTGSVGIHSRLQNLYLRDKYENATLYAEGTGEVSRPEPVHFEWKRKNTDGWTVVSYDILLGESEDLSDAKLYQTKKSAIDVYNLKIGIAYYWQITLRYQDADGVDGELVGDVNEFRVVGTTPRNLYVDGITNARDLGGWETADGGTVRQGLIYRCGRLNDNNSPTAYITAAGIKTMVEDLGIKTEIDLRLVGENGGITKSPLGNGVSYRHIPMSFDGNLVTLNTTQIKKVFHILADESNYPLIFHCSIGTDRTGMIAYLVNGLLGVPKESLYRDYLFSNFGNIGGARVPSKINDYVTLLDSVEGDTLSEKIYRYLNVTVGVPAEELDAILELLKEPAQS